jgi:hypothetical protein
MSKEGRDFECCQPIDGTGARMPADRGNGAQMLPGQPMMELTMQPEQGGRKLFSMPCFFFVQSADEDAYTHCFAQIVAGREGAFMVAKYDYR